MSEFYEFQYNLGVRCSICYAESMHLLSCVGSHTIGLAKCATFSFRLSNFSGTGAPDTTMDTTMVSDLQSRCPVTGDGNQHCPSRPELDRFIRQPLLPKLGQREGPS